MWIRSQDKKLLLSVPWLKVDTNNCVCGYDQTRYAVLGEYSTEEKALKVLDMIQEEILKTNPVTKPAYDGNETMKVLGYAEPPKVFQMPQDDDIRLNIRIL